MENVNINMNDNNLGRVNRGRQRVEMVKMGNESNLQVTFSKRRSGLFKKASELCTLCGVEMALVVFSPGKKVFSFGHPSVEAVLERYAKDRHLLPDLPDRSDDGGGSGVGAGVGNGALKLTEARRNANLQELNAQLAQVMGQLDTEKKRGEEMTKLRKANQAQCWWEKPVEMLDMEQLRNLKMSLVELKKVVHQQAERTMIQASAAVNNAGPPPIPNTPARPLMPPPPPQPPQLPQFYLATLVGSGPRGGSSAMMVPYNNNNNNNNSVGFGRTIAVSNSGIVNNNNSHGGMMMNMPPPPPPPSLTPQQSSRRYNGIGYGGRGFY